MDEVGWGTEADFTAYPSFEVDLKFIAIDILVEIQDIDL